MKIQLGVLGLALMLAACGGGEGDLNDAAAASNAALPQIAAPNNGSWQDVVSRTPEHGTRVGNPDAPVKLVEYGSLTCPACRAFAQAGTQPLLNTYVASGQVSWEFRPLVIHGGPDVVLSMLAECQAPSAFFRTIEDIYAQQGEILDRLTQEEINRLQALPPEQQLGPLARTLQLDSFFARRGMPESRFNECLANLDAARQLADDMGRAAGQGVTGTPTFFINGEQQDVSAWQALEPRLRNAIGG